MRTTKKNIEIVWNLALNDFSTKYAGSAFGTFWAFFQPIITIVVYACVFQFGLKSSSPVEGTSYIFWFASGMVPWFFVSDGIRSVTNVLLEYSYLVKKLVFNIDLLPIIKIISLLLVHFVFVFLVVIIAILNKEPISVYVIQVVYYMICAILLVYVLGKITCAIIPFFRDLGQIVNIILDIGLWATPIIWSYQIVPEKFIWIVNINPIFYIIEGYRDSFINNIWFYEKMGLTIGFWIFIVVGWMISKYVYDKLKPQFADVL